MKATPRTAAVLACVGSVLVLSGCTGTTDVDHAPAMAGPVATATVAPVDAARAARRYQRSGGAREVYGIQRSTGPGGVPLLTVWTHDPDESARTFDRLKASITGFLEREEGVRLGRGYLLDVFGPDGSLQHRLDARL